MMINDPVTGLGKTAESRYGRVDVSESCRMYRLMLSVKGQTVRKVRFFESRSYKPWAPAVEIRKDGFIAAKTTKDRDKVAWQCRRS